MPLISSLCVLALSLGQVLRGQYSSRHIEVVLIAHVESTARFEGRTGVHHDPHPLEVIIERQVQGQSFIACTNYQVVGPGLHEIEDFEGVGLNL